jgi:hypothetical protein
MPIYPGINYRTLKSRFDMGWDIEKAFQKNKDFRYKNHTLDKYLKV